MASYRGEGRGGQGGSWGGWLPSKKRHFMKRRRDADGEQPLRNLSLGSVMAQFSLQSDCLKQRTETSSVPSFSTFGKSYIVSLRDQTCSCPDFCEARSGFAENYFSRWCKHIISAAGQVRAFDDCNVWHRAIAESGGGGPVAAFLVSPQASPEFLTTIGASREWINVYAKTARYGEKLPHLSGPLKHYGWNIAEKRWSYGSAPYGSGTIRKLLVQIEAINEDE